MIQPTIIYSSRNVCGDCAGLGFTRFRTEADALWEPEPFCDCPHCQCGEREDDRPMSGRLHCDKCNGTGNHPDGELVHTWTPTYKLTSFNTVDYKDFLKFITQ